jgi:2-polyprenyl-3-methyl-5-hydroxy-6-metoxy-1,4-benzoquinol methylase
MHYTEITKEEIAKRNREEQEWWNKFSEIMVFQWELTPSLNRILRKDWINDFFSFLYVKNGLLLDVGCGNGWISKYFAEHGMNSLGIDFSEKQIEAAKLSIKNFNGYTADLNFICRNVVELDEKEFSNKFDSIVLSAFLHHLTKPERTEVFDKLKIMLKPKGKIYFFEPIFFEENKSKSKIYTYLYMQIVDFLNLFYSGMKFLGLRSKYYQSHYDRGYRGTSPHEASFSFTEFSKNFESDLFNIEITPIHGFSVVWGFFQMSLKRIPRAICYVFTNAIYNIDKLFLKNSGWKAVSNKIWIMSSIKIQVK